MRPSFKWHTEAMVVGLLFLAGCQHARTFDETSQVSAVDPQTEEINVQRNAHVLVAVGRAHEARGELEQAVRSYQAAIEQDEHHADAYARLAILYDLRGNFEESARLYERALELDPDDPDLLSDVGYSLYQQQRWNEAEPLLLRAVELNPGHVRAHNNLALVLASSEQFDEAIAAFQKGGCSPADARANLAFVHTINNRWQEARGEYERALSLDPSSQTAKQGLQQLQALIAQTAAPAPTRTAAKQPVHLAADQQL